MAALTNEHARRSHATGTWQDASVLPLVPRQANHAAGVTRRSALAAGALMPLAALPLVGCTSTQEGPDPLAALASAARSDATVAEAVAAAHPDFNAAKVVAKARTEQAKALQKEINRVRAQAPSARHKAPRGSGTDVPDDQASAAKQLAASLRAAQRQASVLVPTLPRYRAGLVGSVAAGCASLLEALS